MCNSPYYFNFLLSRLKNFSDRFRVGLSLLILSVNTRPPFLTNHSIGNQTRDISVVERHRDLLC